MKLCEFRLPGLSVTEHAFELPLDHAQPNGRRLRVFARELVAPDKREDELPWLLFLQGGPGCASPRPDAAGGWIARALKEFRVLLLDQRGTGNSSRIEQRGLAELSTEDQVELLQHFRADSIVRDAECIRRELCGDRPWWVLGQSFGGFCLAHYLSVAPEGLSAGLFTGGLPPLEASADEIYRRTYARVARQNRRYHELFPGDVDRLERIRRHLTDGDVRLSTGERLDVRRFQQLGLRLGMSDGPPFLHYLLEGAFVEPFGGAAESETLSYTFLRAVENELNYATNPLYAVLHEPLYAQGEATRWAAERVRAEFPEFALDADPLLLTAEMIYPWMFDEYEELKPLKGAAETLASRASWPRLYDRARLAENSVPCAAIVYEDDPYVEREFSLETAAAIRGLDVWVTNEFLHNGLRAHGERILDELIRRVR